MLGLINARVYTGTGGPPRRALLMNAGRVVELSAQAHPRWRAPSLDLQQRTVLPGWRDAHVHLLSVARQREQLVFHGHEDIPRIVSLVRDRAGRLPPGTWLLGRGWDQNGWKGRKPRREDLDMATGCPVLLSHKDGHVAWANSAALQRAGVDRSTPDPVGGRLARDATGAPTGLLLETAQRLVYAVVPQPSVNELADLLHAALQEAAAAGLVGVANIGTAEEFRALQVLEAADRLPVRVTHVFYHEALDDLLELRLRSGSGSAWLRVGGIKIFVDGSLGSQTAWVEEPYAQAGGTGIVRTAPAVLSRLVQRANAGGLAAVVHAIGDRAVREALEAFEAALDRQSDLRRTPGRNRVEHIQLVRAEDVPRFKALRVLASMQPRHATADARVAEREWGGRCERAYAWQHLLRAGATLAFGSDAPVESLAPLEGLFAAVTRRPPDGGPAWRPEQCLSLADALRAYTVGAGAASSDADATGVLAPGAPADCVILDRDPFMLPAAELRQLRVEATCVGERWAYRAAGFPAG